MNPVIAAAALKAGKEATNYASKVGQAVIDSKENQEEMERKLKLPKGSINKIAEGKDDPKLSTVIGIADMLGTSLDKLTGYVNKNAERTRQEKQMRQSLEGLDKTLSLIGNMDKSAETNEVIDYTKESIADMMERSSKAKGADRTMILRTGMRSLSSNLTSIGKVRSDKNVASVVDYATGYLDNALEEYDVKIDPTKDVIIMKPESMSSLDMEPGTVYGDNQFIEATPEMMYLFDDSSLQGTRNAVRQPAAERLDTSKTFDTFVSVRDYENMVAKNKTDEVRVQMAKMTASEPDNDFSTKLRPELKEKLLEISRETAERTSKLYNDTLNAGPGSASGRSRMVKNQLDEATRNAEDLATDKGLLTDEQAYFDGNEMDFDG